MPEEGRNEMNRVSVESQDLGWVFKFSESCVEGRQEECKWILREHWTMQQNNLIKQSNKVNLI